MLTGPSFVPEKVSRAVILCHGYGASGEDLMGLVPYLKERMPNTAFFAPNAPIDIGFGYQWFELRDFNDRDAGSMEYLSELSTRAYVPAAELRVFIKSIKGKYGLDCPDITLFGFSQGALMALYTALTNTNPEPVGYVAALSTIPLIWTDALAKQYQPKSLKIILTHGARDSMVPVKCMDLTIAELQKAGQKPQAFISEQLEHAIDQPTLDHVVKFITS